MANVITALGIDFPAQDFVIIGADRSPGKATIINGKKPSDWDERKGYGQAGATLVPKGDSLGMFAILFELWSPTDYALYELFYAKYFDPSAKLIPGSLIPKALGISHPVLDQLGITECVVVDRDGFEKDELGLWYQTIYFRQYRKPRPAPQKPIAVIPAIATPQPTAQDAADREIESKLATFNALLGP